MDSIAPTPSAAGPFTPLAPAAVRSLLRKLRDLNLTACPLELAGGRRVLVEGCLSLDRPVESGLRYRLREEAGEHVLGIGWRGGALFLELEGEGHARAVALVRDATGRAAVPELRARVDLETVEPRRLERFLRRVVRGALAGR